MPHERDPGGRRLATRSSDPAKRRRLAHGAFPILGFAFILASAPLSAAGEKLFEVSRTGFSLNAYPREAVAPDLDGDGHRDLAWASARNTNASVHEDVSVALSNGDGTYRDGTSTEVVSLVRDLSFADFDLNGRDDLFVRDAASGGDLYWIPTNPDGTLAAPQPLGVAVGGALIVAYALADFDGNGTTDLAVVHYGATSGWIVLGNGDGTFQTPLSLDLFGALPNGVVAAHLDGDTNMDLAVARDSGAILILLGDGDGTFQQGVTLSTLGGSASGKMLVVDVDGDDDRDILCPDQGSPGADQISVFLGDGMGSFQAPTAVAVSPTSLEFYAVDFDRDGQIDVITRDYYTQDLEIQTGNGDGSFDPPALLFENPGTAAYGAPTDANGDGVPDILAANYDLRGVSVHLGAGDGTLRDPRTLTALQNPQSVTVADFDENGVPDLVLSNGANATFVSVAIGRGDATFDPPTSVPTGRNPTRTIVADFDADGALDLLSYSMWLEQLEVVPGNGDGTFQPLAVATSAPPGFGGSNLASGDFDANGTEDAAVVGPDGVLFVTFGNGDGTFQSPTSHPIGLGSRDVAVADLDGDGADDIVSVNYDDDDASILLSNGDGTFQAATSHPVGDRPSTLALGDLDGDDVVDLVSNTASHRASVSLGLGDGSFAAASEYPAIWIMNRIVIDDIQGDGIPDIGVRVHNQMIAVLEGNGDGSFEPGALYDVDGLGFALADLDRNGTLDIATGDTTFAGVDDVKLALGTRFALSMVPIDEPGNAVDPATGKGQVADLFGISRTEISIAQYTSFLNAVAKSDPNDLYDPQMAAGPDGGITRFGTDGSYGYRIDSGRDHTPVHFVSFEDAMRFANWLHNGRPDGAQDASTTEDGAYTITPAGLAGNSITRNPQALFAVPTEDEWYKAAYFDSQTDTFFAYPTASNAPPTCGAPALTPDLANCAGGSGALTNVGTYPGSPSPFGVLDLAGNAEEWTETFGGGGSGRIVRGGSFLDPSTASERTASTSESPDTTSEERGFRVVPEPAFGRLMAFGALALSVLARRRSPSRRR